ncbi:MAG TPA: class I lanthipeptide [Thermoanaerobaculia bacterium]
MKRNSSVKKLALSRETLRRLSDQTLREAAGGAASTAVTSCQWSECDTCGIICSTPHASCTCPIA